MTTTLDFEIHKKTSIEIAQEHHNMSPVTSKHDHKGPSAVNGKWVFWVQCNVCGKQYKWNQSVWQMRHKRKCTR